MSNMDQEWKILYMQHEAQFLPDILYMDDDYKSIPANWNQSKINNTYQEWNCILIFFT